VQGIGMGKIKNIESGREIIKKSFPPKLFKPKTDTKTGDKMYREYIKLKTMF